MKVKRGETARHLWIGNYRTRYCGRHISDREKRRRLQVAMFTETTKNRSLSCLTSRSVSGSRSEALDLLLEPRSPSSYPQYCGNATVWQHEGTSCLYGGNARSTGFKKPLSDRNPLLRLCTLLHSTT